MPRPLAFPIPKAAPTEDVVARRIPSALPIPAAAATDDAVTALLPNTTLSPAASATAAEYSRYGSNVHKQVYIYGALDTSPTILTRNFGMAWGIGGWLLTGVYVCRANGEFDRLTQEVLKEANK